MFSIGKRLSFCASHELLHLPSSHKCSRLHGHNYEVEVTLSSPELNDDHFILDFADLSPLADLVRSKLDHRHLNDVLPFPPTAENLAQYLFCQAKGFWPEVTAVKVSETPSCWAEFRQDRE